MVALDGCINTVSLVFQDYVVVSGVSVIEFFDHELLHLDDVDEVELGFELV